MCMHFKLKKSDKIREEAALRLGCTITGPKQVLPEIANQGSSLKYPEWTERIKSLNSKELTNVYAF